MPIIKPIRKSLFVKWLRYDLVKKVSDLECHSCERFFSPYDIRRVMRHPNGQGLALTDLLTPVAYVLFLKNRDAAHLVNLVVHPDWRRQGNGTLLLDQVKKRVKRVTAAVRDSNLSAHLFLQDNGFVAVNVMKNHFSEEFSEKTEREDAYAFELKED